MKKLAFTLLLLVSFVKTIVWSQPSPYFDNTFGTNGMVISDLGESFYFTDVIIQPDGKSLAAGISYSNNNYTAVVARYQTNGNLDSTFSVNGMLKYGVPYEGLRDIALQIDGKILIAGQSNISSNVMRFNANGSIDNTFDGDGILNTDISASAIAIQNDGKIILAGSSYNLDGDGDYAVYRYNSNGTIDNTFDSDGKAVINMIGQDEFKCIAIQPDGKILAAGKTLIINLNQVLGYVMRYHSDGRLDSSFHQNGIITLATGVTLNGINDMVLQPNGEILLGAEAGINNDVSILLAQYLTNGNKDYSFGSNGRTYTDLAPGYDELRGLVLQADGKIVVTGRYPSYLSAYSAISLIRYTFDGHLDNSFANGGILVTPIEPISSLMGYAHSLSLQADGKIVVAGLIIDTTSNTSKALLARYLPSLNVGLIDFSLSQSDAFIYPNPIAEKAVLEYTLNQNATVSIELMNMQGKVITTFIKNEERTANTYKQELLLPEGLPSGSYVLVISTEKGQMSIKITK